MRDKFPCTGDCGRCYIVTEKSTWRRRKEEAIDPFDKRVEDVSRKYGRLKYKKSKSLEAEEYRLKSAERLVMAILLLAAISIICSVIYIL